MAWCLPTQLVTKFKTALKNREIDPVKLADMTSKDRHAFLEKYVGKENVVQVNSLFESKLLLKNQQRGFITWATRAIKGDQARRDIISRIEKMDKILNPAEEKMFLEELASKRLGIGITVDEAKNLSSLAQEIKKYEGLTGEMGLPTKEYMVKSLDLMNYINEITPSAGKVDAIRIASEIAGIPRSIMSSADFSASFRQALFMIPRHPILFAKAFVKQFKPAFSEKAFIKVNEDIMSDPFYSLVPKSKLALTEMGSNLAKREEAFISSWIEKVPIVGQIVRGSNRAYVTMLNKFRFDVFKSMVKDAQKIGRNPVNNPELLQNIAGFVSTATGRGGLGKLEGAAVPLASALFSPRLIASRLSLLNPFYYIKLDPFVRKEALKSLFAFASAGTTVLALAEANGAEVETDWRSSDFGKIKIGRTRIDIWAGFQQYIRLAGQLITGEKKSTTTGIISKLGEGYGTPTRFDVLTGFLAGKTAPLVSYVIDWMKGTDFEGEKFDPVSGLGKRMIPMISQDIIDLYKQDDLASLPYQGLAVFGVGVQTYEKTPRVTKWDQSTSQEMKQFKEKVGEERFNQANDDFNSTYTEWFDKKSKTPEYLGLSDDGKKDLITKAKDDIKEKIFKKYRFKPKIEKKNKTETKTIKQLRPK